VESISLYVRVWVWETTLIPPLSWCGSDTLFICNNTHPTANGTLPVQIKLIFTNSEWETLSLVVRSSTLPTPSTNGSITDTELEEPAPMVHDISDSDTDTELEESAPAFHAAGAEMAQIIRLCII